jgi:hypothetical protein
MTAGVTAVHTVREWLHAFALKVLPAMDRRTCLQAKIHVSTDTASLALLTLSDYPE